VEAARAEAEGEEKKQQLDESKNKKIDSETSSSGLSVANGKRKEKASSVEANAIEYLNAIVRIPKALFRDRLKRREEFCAPSFEKEDGSVFLTVYPRSTEGEGRNSFNASPFDKEGLVYFKVKIVLSFEEVKEWHFNVFKSVSLS
jgi:hypothetical protein